jgi:serine kinase of HPr protein (carbohydrate metabolism regulator)
MFLTGPAGAGKSRPSSWLKLSANFFWKHVTFNILFDQYSFYFTVYTGAAAAEFGGITTLTALQVPMYGDIAEATESTISVLTRVKILIMDEISFISVKHLQLISKRLQQLFDCTSPFVGLSVILCGDFRQLQFNSEDQLLYTTKSNMYFENLLNAALIL